MKSRSNRYTGRIKLHKFLPSGRSIWTMVGKEEHWMDPDLKYCSCPAYYYNAGTPCYHLKCVYNDVLVDQINFTDDEFDGFVAALLLDTLKV